KLIPLGSPPVGGGNAPREVYGAYLRVVEVGGLTAQNLEAVAIDLSRISERIGKPIYGVLGQSLLKGRIVQIDYPNRVVRFYSQSLFPSIQKQPNTPKYFVFFFRYLNNVLIDDVFVNGKKMVANLDTGSKGLFNLPPPAVSYLGLDEEVTRAAASSDV